MQSERAVRWDGVLNGVPIMRLAQISGYLALQQISMFVRENIATRVADRVKQLAGNMNRQAKHREERKTYSQDEDEQEDW
ncbi:hypothetical protein ElyMa_002991400 [Elysia marginata]|uniref:Uncharacterized protein n=1 Tax=Elysia marginata TaxID=1093978 RepID=A0AAV4IDC7_9GAST|nr:hypothetical protein ElyMa_002991400 [Elysia marginata]